MKRILILIALMFSVFVYSLTGNEEREICGTILDVDSGEPLIAAVVYEPISKAGTVTDFDGNFCLKIPINAKSVLVTYIGYEDQTVDLTKESDKPIKVKMQESGALLETLVVTGSRSSKSKRRTRTGSSRSKKLKAHSTAGDASAIMDMPPAPASAPAPPAGPKGPAGPSSATSYSTTPIRRDEISSLPMRETSTKESVATEMISEKSLRKKDREREKRRADDYLEEAAPEELMTDEVKVVVEEADGAATEEDQSVDAGTLTAGQLNDFSKWDLWQDLNENELKSFPERWNFDMSTRYSVQLMNKESRPLIDAEVKLVNEKNQTLWKCRTDNTGKAELWSDIFRKDNTNKLNIQISYNGNLKTVKQVKPFKEGVNTITLDAACEVPRVLDIMMTVDATGSMADEIAYLKAELKDVIGQVQSKQKDLKINLGSVFYRDIHDAYLTKSSDFSDDINQAMDFMKEQGASGGGDFPEAVDAALHESVQHQDWSRNAVARIMFLVLDAPPHTNEDALKTLETQIKNAAAKGIRVVPIAASGIDKSTEYLMRAFALATNGTYVFLTDHSGVGNAHIEPSTDDYDMEFLNDLLVRVISEYTAAADCDEPVAQFKDDPEIKEELGQLKMYPNPTQGPINLEVPKDVEELFITDVNGKVIMRLTRLQKGLIKADLSNFPAGLYFVKYQQNGKDFSGKIAVFR